MVSTAITLAVLVALFLAGIKWTIDVVREWPRKKSISGHLTRQRSEPSPLIDNPAVKAFFASILARWVKKKHNQ
jgi:hypothetical protein